MVEHPEEYRWSSYRARMPRERIIRCSPHTLYQALDDDPRARQIAYRELFRYALEPGMVDSIRQATNGNFALGTHRFTEQIADVLGRRAVRGKPGRPRKIEELDAQDVLQEKK